MNSVVVVAAGGVQPASRSPTTLRRPHPQLSPFRRRIQTSLHPPSIRPITASSSSADIQMVRGSDGSWTADDPKVVVLWDLDNKPPRGQPYPAAIALRRAAELFGRVVEISAYANRHAFLHLPRWVVSSRRDRRTLDVLERKGISVPDQPYACGVCGRKFPANADLKRHFIQLHERERQKKLGRMRSLKGKKRLKYKQRFVSGNQKYEEAARELLSPKTGYGLGSELRRAGVFVKTVEDKPQAADAAVKRQMRHSMSRGIDCLLLVSDDSDFSEMIGRARAAGLQTVVIGDGRRTLGRLADFWVSWAQVENGELGEEVLISGRNSGFRENEGKEDELFSSSSVFYNDDDDDWEEEDDDDDFSDLDDLIDDVVVQRSGFGSVKVSAFSEEEMWDGEKVRRRTGNNISGVLGATAAGRSLSWIIGEDENDYYI